MKKKIFCILVLFICFVLTGCSSERQDQEEIDRLGDIINGT